MWQKGVKIWKGLMKEGRKPNNVAADIDKG